jgi:hypothetical protein
MKRNIWTSIGGLHPMKAGMEDWKLPLTNMEVRGGAPAPGCNQAYATE